MPTANPPSPPSQTTQVSNLLLLAGPYNPTTRVLLRSEGPRRLSPTEARLLGHLAASPDRVFSREELLRDVWGYKPGTRTRTLYSTIERLRRKVEVDPKHPDHICTVHGGYRFQARAPVEVSTDLVGRGRAVATVAAVLERAGAAVLLTGPGGVGKSRLARELLSAFVPSRLPRGTRVDLAGVSTTAMARHHIARSLGLQGVQAAARVEQALRARAPFLLLLDDLDHLAAAAPREAAALLTLVSDADVRTIATCRAHLDGPGLEVVPLPPLTPAAARTLLLRRAAAGHAGWTSSAERAVPGTPGPGSPGGADHPDGAVEHLVGCLDRLPLALELAATWLPLLPVDALVTRLDELMAVPALDRRPPHHRSLSACVLWSWELLGPAHQQALGRLSCWPVALPPGATAALLADMGSPLALIAHLRQRSLVQVDEAGWVRVLATVRRAVPPPTCPGEMIEAMVGWLEELQDDHEQRRHGPDHGNVMARMDTLAPLVGAILDAMPPGPARAQHVVRWVPVALRLGPDPKLGHRLRQAAEDARQLDDDGVLAVRVGLAEQRLARRPGHPSIEALDSLAAGLFAGHPMKTEVELERGIVLKKTGRSEAATRVLLAVVDDDGATPTQQGRALFELANLKRRAGHPDAARRHLESAANLALRTRNPLLRMLVAGGLGSVARQQKRWMEAEVHQRRALELAHELREWENVAHVSGNLANVLMAAGNYTEALQAIHTALQHYRTHGHLGSEAYARQTEASLRHFLGHHTDAARLAELALEGFRAAGDGHGVCYTSAFLIVLAIGQQHHTEAHHRAASGATEALPPAGRGQIAALGAIAAQLAGSPDPSLANTAWDLLPHTDATRLLRDALDQVSTEPTVVQARLSSPAWVHAALW